LSFQIKDVSLIYQKRRCMTAIDYKNALGLRYKPDQFTQIESAKRWADRCNKLHSVILGCNGMFWVVCFADAQRLVKAGYEIAI